MLIGKHMSQHGNLPEAEVIIKVSNTNLMFETTT